MAELPSLRRPDVQGRTPVRARILLADPLTERRAALAAAFGPGLVPVTDGRQALELLRSRAFDVAVLAIDLPGPSGAEVAARLGEEGVATRIVLHGEAGPGLSTASRLDNVITALPRPVSAADVERAVRRALDAGPLQTIPPDASGPVERAPRLLVVSADAGLRSILEDRLMAFDVWTAPTGPEAVRLARQRRWDVALVDLVLPVVDGAWTTKRLQDDGNGAKVLLMHDDDRVVDVARKLGAGVVRKPIDLLPLQERLRRAARPH